MATEKRLIDANEVLEVICDYCPDDVPCPVGGCAEFQKISRLLTADAVEVVRCKDCKHWKQGDSNGGNSIEDLQWIGGCKWAKCCRREMDYCSFGERKDNETD